MTTTIDASYYRMGTGEIARQVFVDSGCILDVTADGRLVGVEILGARQLAEVMPAVLRLARFG